LIEIEKRSKEGYRNVLLLIDTYSRAMITVPVVKTRNAARKLKIELKELETEVERSVATVRSDKGGDFVNRKLMAWDEKGHQGGNQHWLHVRVRRHG
jgi:hypothetical protein